jgi:hypothetical protein
LEIGVGWVRPLVLPFICSAGAALLLVAGETALFGGQSSQSAGRGHDSVAMAPPYAQSPSTTANGAFDSGGPDAQGSYGTDQINPDGDTQSGDQSAANSGDDQSKPLGAATQQVISTVGGLLGH